MKYKVYVISTQLSDADWLEMEQVYNMDDADVVYFHGYSDLHPSTYSLPAMQETSIYTNGRLSLDNDQVTEYLKAVSSSKFIIGCNRGLHLIATQVGAGIVQHMQHPIKHRITMYDGTKISVPSFHHQMISLVRMNSTDYQLIGYAGGLSPFYLNGNDNGYTAHTRDEKQVIVEPEIIHFPSIKGLGFQFNPNEFPYGSKPRKICTGLVKRLLDYNLFSGVDLKIPVSLLTEDDFKLSKQELKNSIIKKHVENV